MARHAANRTPSSEVTAMPVRPRKHEGNFEELPVELASVLAEFTSGSLDLDAAQRIGINEPTLSMKQTGKSLRKHILRGTAASTMQPVV
jgi:hypothetical protein